MELLQGQRLCIRVEENTELLMIQKMENILTGWGWDDAGREIS